MLGFSFVNDDFIVGLVLSVTYGMPKSKAACATGA